MKVLITGSQGFIGKNIVSILKNNRNYDVFQYDIDIGPNMLKTYTKNCDFVLHLAGVNRPKDESEFKHGNVDFTSTLIDTLIENNNRSPILMSSSIQADMDNPYGRSKNEAENLLNNYSQKYSVPIYIYRLPNVFGKWCRPNYNSVVATFCHNIANNIDIVINDSNAVVKLVYIDDVVQQFIGAIHDKKYNPPIYQITVGDLAKLIYSFKESRNTKIIANLSDDFTRKLYATYLSYIPHDSFCYPLKMNVDARGSFTEFVKTLGNGQISINISKPGVTKGNHWHNTKNEKFLVVSGKGIVRFREIGCDEIIEYCVKGDRLEVIDIPPGYTHNITNIGDDDLITVMWASEQFDPDNTDTVYEEV